MAGGLGMALSSCHQDILRDGNQSTAGLIGVLGIVAAFLGWNAWRNATDRPTEVRRVWMCLVLENFALVSLLVAAFLLAKRNTFFASPISGGDMVGTLMLLVMGLIVIASGCAVLRPANEQPGTSEFHSFPRSTWAAFGFAVAVAALLNSLPRVQRVVASNRVKIAITSQGFPLAITKQLSFTPISGEAPQQLDLLLPDGTLMQFNKDYVTRSDKTLVHFDKRYATKPDGEIVPLDDRFIASLSGNCKTNSNTLTVRLPGWRPRTYDARQIHVTLLDGTTIGFKLGRITACFHGELLEPEPGSVLCSLRNGAAFYYEKDQLTALLLPEAGPAVTTLPDKTQLRFDKGKVDLTLGHHENIHADVFSGKASFSDGTTRRRNLYAIGVDAVLAVLFAAYFAVCWVRLDRARARSVTETDSPQPPEPASASSRRRRA